MAYNFTAQWLKGTQNEAADALSCHPCHLPSVGDDLTEYDTDVNLVSTLAPSITQIRASISDLSDMESLHLHKLRRHDAEDQEYQALKEIILGGFPNQNASLKERLKKFWSIKDNLSIDDDLIVYGCHLYIPHSLRATMLSRLYEAHQDISRSQAHLTIYWSGIDLDITNFVKGCRHYQDHLPSNAREPLISKATLERPFQQIAVDFASYGGRQFVIILLTARLVSQMSLTCKKT